MTETLPGGSGWLLGFVEDGQPHPLLALSCSHSSSRADWTKWPLAPPAGLLVLGIYSNGGAQPRAAQHLSVLLADARRENRELGVAEAEGYLLCAVSEDGAVSYFLGKDLQPTKVLPRQERSELFRRAFVGVRARLAVKLKTAGHTGVDELASQLRSGSLHFDFTDAPQLGIVAPASFADENAPLCSSLAGCATDENCDEDEIDEDGGTGGKKRAAGGKGRKGGGKSKGSGIKKRPGGGESMDDAVFAATAAELAAREIFSARVLLEVSPPQNVTALSLSLEPCSGKSAQQPQSLQLDAIVQCRRDSPLCLALHSLRLELARQVEKLGGMLSEGSAPVACVVQPEAVAVPLTLIYALREGEEAAEPSVRAQREALHHALGLPCDRPLLRTCNVLGGGEVGAHGIPGLLRDVHQGLGPSGLAGGSISLVQGSYEYYHYLQPTGNGQKLAKYDDNGWGAYRSLMSIISWFRLQKYTSFENPTHYEIQKVLVDHCGQDADDLLGKKKWLGSFDLSLFLEHALGVQCKTISCNSGHDIAINARQLCHHFDTQGTPVMIGGGQLAFTLLGVDFNDKTGEARFLIMDPHYTGPDDLAQIQPKWVGWKSQDSITHMGTKLFQKGETYNLCLPQRPSCV